MPEQENTTKHIIHDEIKYFRKKYYKALAYIPTMVIVTFSISSELLFDNVPRNPVTFVLVPLLFFGTLVGFIIYMFLFNREADRKMNDNDFPVEEIERINLKLKFQKKYYNSSMIGGFLVVISALVFWIKANSFDSSFRDFFYYPYISIVILYLCIGIPTMIYHYSKLQDFKEKNLII